MEKLTKLNAAKREINAAIRMFFIEEDPIAVQAVAAGGLQIISDLASKKGVSVGIESFLDAIIEERRDEFRQLMRKPQNFLKHADRKDDENAVLEFNVESVEIYLLLASQAFQTFTGRHTPETRIFYNWFLIHNPSVIADGDPLAHLAYVKVENGIELNKQPKSFFLGALNDMRYRRAVDDTVIDYS